MLLGVAGHTDSIEDVAFCPVLPVAITASVDGQVIIWDHANAVIRQTCRHPEVRQFVFSLLSGSCLAACWSLVAASLQGITRVACHHLQPLLFTACLDGIVRCWDIRSGD